MESKTPFRHEICNIVANMGHFDRLKIQKLGNHQSMYYYYIRVDQLVADFTGKEDVWTQAELVPDTLVAHGLPEVLQAEDCWQSHEAIRVVSCFGCHVSLFFSSSDQRQGRGPEEACIEQSKVLGTISFHKRLLLVGNSKKVPLDILSWIINISNVRIKWKWWLKEQMWIKLAYMSSHRNFNCNNKLISASFPHYFWHLQ